MHVEIKQRSHRSKWEIRFCVICLNSNVLENRAKNLMCCLEKELDSVQMRRRILNLLKQTRE